MLPGAALLLSLLLNARVIWAALGSQTTDPQDAMVHVLVTFPVLLVLLLAVRAAGRRRDPQPRSGEDDT